jgi:hypothetical protein
MGRSGVVFGLAALGMAAACGGAVSGPAGGFETADSGVGATPAIAATAPHTPSDATVTQSPSIAPQPVQNGAGTQAPDAAAPQPVQNGAGTQAPDASAPQPVQNGAGTQVPLTDDFGCGCDAAAPTMAGAPPTCRPRQLLYYKSTGLPGVPNSIPVECAGPNPIEWSSVLCSTLSGTANTQVCVDAGWGLTGQGMLEHPRSQSALAVLTNPSGLQVGSSWADSSWIHCQRGGFVGVTWDCGSVPVGAGGTITTGVYVLAEYVRYGGDSFPSLGAHIWQTLYVTSSSVLFVSDDDNNFGFDGTYTYSVQGNRIAFTAVSESSLPDYRAFPGSATFQATPSAFELYDATRQVRATYVWLDSH